MTYKLTVRRGGAPGAASTDFTVSAPAFSDVSGKQPVIRMGMRFANGEASNGNFTIVDPDADLPKADFTFNLPAKSVVLWTEDASGGDVWLSRGRITSAEGGRRGIQIPGDAVEFDVIAADANADVRGLALDTPWIRPAETDVARLLALGTAFLNGSPRASTVITVSTSHLTPNSNTVAMPAKTYPVKTELNEIINDCATTAGKVWGVEIHHAGGSHLCLEYIIETDHTTWLSTVKISDHDDEVAESATPPIYAPRWLAGKGLSADGTGLDSKIISTWGPEASQVAIATDATTETSYDYWAEGYDDSDSVNATQAALRAEAVLQYRQFTHVTHRVSVAVPADKTTLLSAGMSIQIKAAAALGGQYLNTWQTRRIAQLIWEPRNDGYYWAHLELDRSLKRAPYSNGKAAPASIVPKPTTPAPAATALVDWTWSDPGPGYPSGFSAYQQAVAAYPSISQSAFTMNNGLNNNQANYRSGAAGGGIPINGGTKYLPCTVGVDIAFEADIGNRISSVSNVTLGILWRTAAAGSDISTTSLFNGDLGPVTPQHISATLTPPAGATVWRPLIKGRIDNVVASTGGAVTAGTLPADQAGTDAGHYSLIDHNHDHGNLLDLNQPTDHPFFIEHRGNTTIHLQAKLDATAAPGVTNDADEGYVVGSLWVDTTADHTYVATDVTAGAAVWVQTDGAGGGSALTIKDEGTPLATDATSLDFVGAGVVASGTGAAKTITIGGGFTNPMTTEGDLIRGGASGAAGRLAVGADGYSLVSDGTDPVYEAQYSAAMAVIGNGVDVITTGAKGVIGPFPFDCYIEEVTLLEATSTSASIVLDLWLDTYTNYAPTITDTITASAKPTLSTAIKSQDSTLTGWSRTIAAGSILKVNVDSITAATQIALTLKVRKT